MFYREPILVSYREDGLYVAASFLTGSMQGIASTRVRAKKLLGRKLAKSLAEMRTQPLQPFKLAVLEQRAFSVQPMYIQKNKRYPAGPNVNVTIRYVRLQDQWDKLFGVLPDLDIHFYCPVESDFSQMLQETVRSVLAAVTPEEIVNCWAPSASELEWLRIRFKSRSGAICRARNPALASVAEPLNRTRRPLLPAELRQSELRQIQEHLLVSNCLLVGETGVGKSTLLQIATRDVFRTLRATASSQAERQQLDGKFWWTSASRLIAGMKYLGQWQERLEQVIAELGELQGVLLIENLRDLITCGGQSPSDSLGAFLIPYLRSGQVRIVCEATPAQFEFCQRQLPSLADLMSVVRIEPMGREDETRLVRYVLSQRCKLPLAKVDYSLSATIQRLCRHYFTGRPAPNASVAFVEQWVGKMRTKIVASASSAGLNLVKSESMSLTADEAIEEFSRWTGLPTALLQDNVLLNRSTVTDVLAKEVIGQELACNAAASVVLRIKSAMNDVAKPFGCLLFCGPTGVGKTQLAKSLAKYLFGADGQRTRLIRLDMSEYQSVAAGYRFLNDSDGNPSRWIQQVRNQPLHVLLFDEIEKASPEVFDILLSLLDEGRLTDKFGNLTSFRSTIVLMTSNLGAKQQSLSGFQGATAVDYSSAVSKSLRPEFVNRLDAIVPFSPLKPECILAMTRKELEEAIQREGIQRLGLKLSFGEQLVQHLAKIGFSNSLGARPLQKTIETAVIASLARWIVETMPTAGSKIQLDWDGTEERIRFINSPFALDL